MAATHATRTVQKAHNCLTRAIRHAEGQDLVRRNVSVLVDTPRGQEGRPSQSLTVEQAAALLRESEKSRLHAFITLCLLTGVRSEEARALTWELVDLKAGTVSVWRSVRATGETKTERSRRTLKLPVAAVKALRRMRSSRPTSAPVPVRCGKSTAWYSSHQWERRLNPTTSGAISTRSPRRPESANAGSQRNFGHRSSA
jgi:integrase